MIKVYRKTATIKAEQFDGSQQLVDKYEILVGSAMFNGYVGEPSLCYIQTLEGNLRIHVGDWIATGINGERWAVADEIFKQTYQELPVIPQTIARAMAAYRHIYGDDKGLSILLADWQRVWALGVLPELTDVPQLILESYRDKAATIARAWLDGYEIDNKS